MAGGEVLGEVTDSNNGWYTASYVLQKVGPYAVAIGLSGAWGSGTFAGLCQHTTTAAEHCILLEEQNAVVAGQQAKLRIARFDRCASNWLSYLTCPLYTCCKGLKCRLAKNPADAGFDTGPMCRFGNKVTTAEGQPSFCVDVEGPGAAATEVVESGSGEVSHVFGQFVHSRPPISICPCNC